MSEAFYKWMLGQEDSFTAQDLQFIDPDIARTFSQLADVAVKKRQLENDPLLVKQPVLILILLLFSLLYV